MANKHRRKILSYTFIRIQNFSKNLKKLEKNDFFEKSPKTQKIIFFDFFQDFQNSSSIFKKTKNACINNKKILT